MLGLDNTRLMSEVSSDKTQQRKQKTAVGYMTRRMPFEKKCLVLASSGWNCDASFRPRQLLVVFFISSSYLETN